MNNKLQIDIFKKAALSRNFELNVVKYVQNKTINMPVYLSVGQELISASLSSMMHNLKIKPLLFPQHRCHSIYLCFGGDIVKLIDELLGRRSGCSAGNGGSPSIHSKKINMFGHDGHMGTQAPIGVGACFTSKKPTIVFLGDASAEEDYVLGAIGWASTKRLPILFVVEDNNLSILTRKKVRRNWNMHDLAKSFKMDGYEIKDDPKEIYKFNKLVFKKPMLLNIKTNRIFWHAGAGKDSERTFDRYKYIKQKLGDQAIDIDNHYKTKMDLLWQKQLEKQ
tara:strand:+ start:911 stop:1747 length:837 start_codon:yes stop_codon:yes gene_type:complete